MLIYGTGEEQEIRQLAGPFIVRPADCLVNLGGRSFRFSQIHFKTLARSSKTSKKTEREIMRWPDLLIYFEAGSQCPKALRCYRSCLLIEVLNSISQRLIKNKRTHGIRKKCGLLYSPQTIFTPHLTRFLRASLNFRSWEALCIKTHDRFNRADGSSNCVNVPLNFLQTETRDLAYLGT